MSTVVWMEAWPICSFTYCSDSPWSGKSPSCKSPLNLLGGVVEVASALAESSNGLGDARGSGLPHGRRDVLGAVAMAAGHVYGNAARRVIDPTARSPVVCGNGEDRAHGGTIALSSRPRGQTSCLRQIGVGGGIPDPRTDPVHERLRSDEQTVNRVGPRTARGALDSGVDQTAIGLGGTGPISTRLSKHAVIVNPVESPCATLQGLRPPRGGAGDRAGRGGRAPLPAARHARGCLPPVGHPPARDAGAEGARLRGPGLHRRPGATGASLRVGAAVPLKACSNHAGFLSASLAPLSHVGISIAGEGAAPAHSARHVRRSAAAGCA